MKSFSTSIILLIFSFAASSPLWSMEERGKTHYGPLYIQDIYGYKQTLGLGRKIKEGREQQVVSGHMRFPDDTKMEVNDMPFGRFKKLIGMNEMFLTFDELPEGEKEIVERENRILPQADTDTVKLKEKLDQIQFRIHDINQKVAAIKGEGQVAENLKHLASDPFKKVMEQLDPFIRGYLDIHGSSEEKSYQIARALSLFVLALEGYNSRNTAIYFVDRESNIANYLRSKGIIDVKPWFDALRNHYSIPRET